MVVYLSKPASKVVEGSPSVLVQRGFLIPDSMNRERVSPGEILSQMHQSGLERLSQVQWWILETDGKMSFVPWEGDTIAQRQDDQEMV